MENYEQNYQMTTKNYELPENYKKTPKKQFWLKEYKLSAFDFFLVAASLTYDCFPLICVRWSNCIFI